jgi:hypothetical protein
MTEQHPVDNISDAWRWKFDFYNTYGQPGSSPAAKAAFRALPFGKRLRLASNFLAFLFGPIYFFVKGMWRKGLSLLGIWIVVMVILAALHIPDNWVRAFGIGLAAMAMSLANYAYYLHVVRGSESWNLFEGLGRRS